MMAADVWIAFALTSVVLLVVPGPTVLLVVSHALGGGRSTGWATVPGVAMGDLTAMTVSLLGAGAVLAASATLFTVLKLCGAAYLVWMGIQLWRADPAPEKFKRSPATPGKGRLFSQAYVVTALNPKSIVFFVAFVPQFVDPARPTFSQFAILETTFVLLAASTALSWVLLVDKMKRLFRQRAALRRANRLGGSCLIGAGLLTAISRQA